MKAATKKIAEQLREQYPDEEDSTVAPSDTLRDDASELTDTSAWVGLELGDESLDRNDDGSTASTASTVEGGRLVAGPGGRPVRVFGTSAELRKARIAQLRAPAQGKAGGSKVSSKGGGKGSTAAGPQKDSAEAKKRAAARQPDVKPEVAVVPPVRPAKTPEENKAAPDAKVSAKAKSEKASRPTPAPSAAAYGAHRTLGQAGTTHSLPCGHISFKDTPVGGAQRRSQAEMDQSCKADALKRALDKQSREELRDVGLWEYMPVNNPVMIESDSERGGFNWHRPFPAQEFQHTLGGVAEPKPVERPHQADELFRALDKQSREELRDMGVWEHTPVKNPIMIESDSERGGYNWHRPFPAQEFVHTLGGVPDCQQVERPHDADVLHRRLDAVSRERIRSAGMWEHCPAKNPVATESDSTRGGVNWSVAF